MTFQKTNKPDNANGVQPDDPAPHKPASSSARPKQEPPLADVEPGSDADVTPEAQPAEKDTERKTGESGEQRRFSQQRS